MKVDTEQKVGAHSVGGDAAFKARHIMTPGYGIVKDGKLLIRTVSNSPRAGMINGLAILFNVWTTENCTDQQIRREFEQRTAGREIYLVRVEAVAKWPPIVLREGEDISISAEWNPDEGASA